MSRFFSDKKKILLLSKLMISGILLWFLVHTAQIRLDLFKTFFHQPLLLCVIIILFFAIVVIGAYRWYKLNTAQGIHLSFQKTIFPTYLGVAFNNLLPGSIGGDFVRLFHVFQKFSDKKSNAFLAILMDRVIGFIGILFLICFFSFYYVHALTQQKQISFLTSMAVISGLSILGVFLAFFIFPHLAKLQLWIKKHFETKRWGQVIISLLEAITHFQNAKIILLECLSISVVAQIMITCIIIMIGNIMHAPPISFVHYVIAMSITQIINLIPITPGGIGIGEMAFANILLLLNPGVNAAYATLFLAFRLISMLCYLPAAIVSLPRFIMGKKQVSP